MKIRRAMTRSLLLLAVAGTASAQTANPAAGVPPASTLSTQSILVLLPTLVREKSGDLVYALTADDFTLTDDGVPQKLKLEEDRAGEPLALVVVIEAGAAIRSAGWRPDDHDPTPDRFHSLPTLIEAMVGAVPHRIAVVGFDSKVDLLQPFTSNFTRVAAAIEDFDTDQSDHGAAILDSLGFAVDLLRHQPPLYRRAILLLSETNDRGSQLPLPDAVRAITDTNTAIYSVAFSTGFAEASAYGRKNLPTKRMSEAPVNGKAHMPALPGTPQYISNSILDALTRGVTLGNPDPYPPGGCLARDPSSTDPVPNKATRAYDCLGQLAPPLALARMMAIATVDGLAKNIPETVARLTGGEYFKFNDARSLARDLATLANHVPNRYILSFQPHTPHPGLHAIKLQVNDRPGLTVTSRTSYWADSPVLPPAPRKPGSKEDRDQR